jgi:hypothetical protein
VQPSPHATSAGRLSPAYEVTYFNNCCAVAVHQALYPYAGGGPLVYTPPGQRMAFSRVFGRFWGGGVPSGWARARDALLNLLVSLGLPATAPVPGPLLPRPASHPPVPWAPIGLAALVVLLVVAVAVRHRLRSHTRRAA